MNIALTILGKFIYLISKTFNLGSGSTWPGHLALFLNKNFIKTLLAKNPHLKIVLIAGTNGKTTTGKLIQTILEKDGRKVFQNAAGANLVNGIASSLLLHSSILCTVHYDYAIFEVDENSLPLVLNELTPHSVVLLNLFRDQLDRYGEVNTIAKKWLTAIKQLSNLSARNAVSTAGWHQTLQAGETLLLLNADDPQIVALDPTYKAKYFGIDDKKLAQKKSQHAADSTYCPFCNNKLNYDALYFSHLGAWNCTKCNHKRPTLDVSSAPFYPLVGVHNYYNLHAAVLFAGSIGISEKVIESALHDFTPAFGRQEIIEIYGKKVQMFLSKNPTSFNESLRTAVELKGKHLLFVLNDRIPDGRDVSWIWDVDFEDFIDDFEHITVSGDRAYDMALRLKYSFAKYKIPNTKYSIFEQLEEGVKTALTKTTINDTLYILPTYSAMLETRKILTGRRIL